MSKKKISIIVPVYKVENYLNECIHSIVNQTYKNLEIILVDDGSPDSCPEICDAWANKDNRIKVIHKENGGLSSARNAGLDAATGEYIGFVDSDDYIAENMYEALLSALAGSEKGMVCCGICTVTEDRNIIEKRPFSKDSVMTTNQALDAVFYMRVDTSSCCKLYKKEVFNEVRFPVGEINEDFPVIIPLIVAAKGMICVNEYYYNYRRRTGSITNTSVMNEKESLRLYTNLKRMQEQLNEVNYGGLKSFRFFSAQYAFYRGTVCEKKYAMLTENLRKDYKLYRKIMKGNAGVYLFTSKSTIKEKLLYILVLTKLLRPIYKLIHKDLS